MVWRTSGSHTWSPVTCKGSSLGGGLLDDGLDLRELGLDLLPLPAHDPQGGSAAGVRWYGMGGFSGWGAGLGGRARGRAGWGYLRNPGASRPARTGHRRVGRAQSLGLELLLELLDLPREIEGGAARVGVRLRLARERLGVTGGGGQPRCESSVPSVRAVGNWRVTRVGESG